MRNKKYKTVVLSLFVLFLLSCSLENGFAATLINPPVTSFEIKGNASFSDDELRDLTDLGKTTLFNIPQFSEDALTKDVSRIRSFYNSKGFLFVDVKSDVEYGPRKAWARVSINVTEGIRAKISNIKIIGIHNFKMFEIEAQIKSVPDTFLNPYQINDDKRAISKFYNNHGYIFNKVDIRYDFNEDKTEAEVSYVIEERQLVYVNKIEITGLGVTKAKIVKRELEILEGDILLWQKLVDTERNLNSLGIFTDVNFGLKEKDESKNRADLKLQLKELLQII